MIPETISFTGLELSPQELTAFRVHPGPIPADWTTVCFKHDGFDERRIIEWVMENIDGRFGIILSYPRAIVFFENEIDAVIFRLKDGDNAFNSEPYL